MPRDAGHGQQDPLGSSIKSDLHALGQIAHLHDGATQSHITQHSQLGLHRLAQCS